MSTHEAMAATYVQITREEFEAWLKKNAYKWERDKSKAGIYFVNLSDNVAVKISTSIGSRDEAMARARASVKMSLVSRHTGQTVLGQKKGQGSSHFKRTKGWKETWKKGIENLKTAYMRAKDFYDKISRIKDRKAYAADWQVKIESVPGWEGTWLKTQHEKVKAGKLLSDKAEAGIEREISQAQSGGGKAAPSTPQVDDKLINALRQAYAAARRARRDSDMKFLETLGKQVKRGYPPKGGQVQWWEDIQQRYHIRLGSIERVAAEHLRIHWISEDNTVTTHEVPHGALSYVGLVPPSSLKYLGDRVATRFLQAKQRVSKD